MAGTMCAGVLSEVVDRRDGSMARTPYLLEFAGLHGLKCITIADLVQHLQVQARILEHMPLANGMHLANHNGAPTGVSLTGCA